MKYVKIRLVYKLSIFYMNMSTILTEKKENSIKIKKSLWVLLKFKPLWLIKISNTKVKEEIIEWLKIIPAGFVVYSEWVEVSLISNNVVITWNIDDSLLSWFDFIVCDDDICNLNSYFPKAITPIILRDNHMSAILKEFNPVKNEGNSFFYNELNKWAIFHSIVRYLENYKFPYDNKNLVKNILSI